MTLALSTDGVASLPNITGKQVEWLERLQIRRIFDLTLHVPYRYLDYTRVRPLKDVDPGVACVIEGQIIECAIRPGRRARSLAAKLDDGTGEITIRFFRNPHFLLRKLAVGKRVRCFGTPYRLRHLEISHPRFEVIEGRAKPLPRYLTPVYPTTSGLKQDVLAQLIDTALTVARADPKINRMDAYFSDQALMPLNEALTTIHRVSEASDAERILMKSHPSIRTVIFHDIFSNLLAIEKLKLFRRRQHSISIPYDARRTRARIDKWPFALTGAQKRVIEEIGRDLNRPHPMLRLLQGDVGSGKTVVAAFAAWQCKLAGRQTAILAPTEILCEQHVETFTQWFDLQELRVQLLTSSLGRKQRQLALSRIINGEVDVVVGTHALFQSDVRFYSLGLVIIDEQQRFGVEHRIKLSQDTRSLDGHFPHQLMMTATPIPRTLATAKFSIIDCSVLDEMPPGRQQTRTSIMSDTQRERLIERVRLYVKESKQVFWVLPRIEDVEEGQELLSIESLDKILSSKIGGESTRIVHGRLKPKSRERIIADFRDQKFPILIATTVVEVGVDIPNASLMIIEHAERLGLSQIHQLRGRVGRGHTSSDCVLLYHPPLSSISEKRLKAAYRTNGFELARLDLKLRGAGDFFGTQQSGTMNMRVGNMFRDEKILLEAHTQAKRCIENHPERIEEFIDLWVTMTHDIAL